MCYNCGCGLAEDDMGAGTALLGGKSITEETFGMLAEQWSMTQDEVKVLIYQLLCGEAQDVEKEAFLDKLYDDAAKSQGMTKEEAKDETQKLLKQVLKK